MELLFRCLNGLLSCWQMISPSDFPPPNEFNPQEYLSRLSEVCSECTQRVGFSDSISICKCYMFTHYKCLLRRMKQTIITNPQYQCSGCESTIKFRYSGEVYLKTRISRKNIIQISITIFLMMAFIVIGYILLYQVIPKQPSMHDIRDSKEIQRNVTIIIEIILISVGLFYLLWIALKIMLETRFKIRGVQETGRKLVASAFENLETFEEQSPTVLELFKKKTRSRTSTRDK